MTLKFIDLKIKKILTEKTWSMKELLAKIDLSEQGYSYMLKNNSMKVDTLLKISDVLQVPINYFFDETVSSISGNLSGNKIVQHGNGEVSNNISISMKDNEIEKLHIEIEGLKKEILLLREINELLKSKH